MRGSSRRVTPICLASSVTAGVSTAKVAGQQHLPVVAGLDQVVESLPGVGREKAGHVGQRLLFDDGLGDDDQLIVLAGNVEVLHVVAQVVAIAEDAAARADGEREGEAVLAGVGARVHARLHDALADGVRVAEAREVPDGIKVHDRSPSKPPARTGWNSGHSSGR